MVLLVDLAWQRVLLEPRDSSRRRLRLDLRRVLLREALEPPAQIAVSELHRLPICLAERVETSLDSSDDA